MNPVYQKKKALQNDLAGVYFGAARTEPCLKREKILDAAVCIANDLPVNVIEEYRFGKKDWHMALSDWLKKQGNEVDALALRAAGKIIREIYDGPYKRGIKGAERDALYSRVKAIRIVIEDNDKMGLLLNSLKVEANPKILQDEKKEEPAPSKFLLRLYSREPGVGIEGRYFMRRGTEGVDNIQTHPSAAEAEMFASWGTANAYGQSICQAFGANFTGYSVHSL